MQKTLKHPKQYPGSFEAVENFFTCFTPQEAHQLTQKMIRAAFAKSNHLDKRDVLDLLHLKEQLLKLIDAAEALAKDQATAGVLGRLFRCKRSEEWKETLNELFHAAVYDGFFTTPPADDDIYRSCQGLLKLIQVCALTITSSSINLS